jgi:hypothetical protein
MRDDEHSFAQCADEHVERRLFVTKFHRVFVTFGLSKERL